ncbi:hypothetical protein CUU80_00890 [Bifidobacterium scaligerum]|uniref:Uncharacterized protein n=1 Tax=Bifidobacterium scaligerum TaxID=2052656 RepID=A0A2M9HSD9_9BIFI|nr:hypothetical protein CUU80_00890 [Bifidobacterium scaligerum]
MPARRRRSEEWRDVPLRTTVPGPYPPALPCAGDAATDAVADVRSDTEEHDATPLLGIAPQQDRIFC